MSVVLDDDLLIIATERVVVPSFSATTRSVEIRLDSRRMERRRPQAPSTGEDGRGGVRRSLDVGSRLRGVGWVFTPAAQGRLQSTDNVGPGAPLPPADRLLDERYVRQRLAIALQCAPCIAR